MKDYAMITIAMLSYCIGWSIFLLPNNITTGGVPGIASILEWSPLHIPAQTSYFVINAGLLLMAFKILGWKFCVKTVYAVVVLTVSLTVTRDYTSQMHLLHDQPFMASVLGAVFCGCGVGLGLSSNGRNGHHCCHHQQIPGHLSGTCHHDLRCDHHHVQLRCPERLGACDLRLRCAIHHCLLY